MVNRPRVGRIGRIHTNLIRTDPSDPFLLQTAPFMPNPELFLFIAERFDWIEAGGFACRIVAK